GNEWSGDMHYYPSGKSGNDTLFRSLKKGAGVFSLQRTPFVDSRTRSSIVGGVMDDKGKNTAYYLEEEMNRMMSKLSRDMRDILSSYSDVAIINISGLIPEFVYYIRAAEFIEKYTDKGYSFCVPRTGNKTVIKEFYNIRLAVDIDKPDDIVKNDMSFDEANRIYILTGANRDGKTTLTQGIGILFLMAQGGLYTSADDFEFEPVDSIYTHFPADEDKTTDLGRLGEECIRFKEIYDHSTSDSLILLNETYSTTSFEEGYYIAKDSIRALLKKNVRMIYNTHMHKLGQDIDEMNSDDTTGKAVSIVMRTDGSKRSFKVELAPPEGISFASDIAKKYGVTYDQLIAADKALT
ncbi:MAG: DNA mismatch repair protein, partial [Eubacterium sp.]|nr:DNA mismatch repair protein [Eubacterium sp.]